jgi:hypothetical protein
VNYLDQIRIAYDASGPKGACGMILVVASEIARSQGRYDHRLIFKTLLDAGFKEFIPSKLSDNKALLKVDPDYKANLEALSFVERERLLHGNWKIRPAAGLYFNRCVSVQWSA